ncbi:signal recognition particle, SRP9/SRP14 subunit [Crepidotus variabilis]|uniref:Signal recognition particle, SRP9/SRP14 subunit n=1 Tax=Crepidotus variabilis TaxID=179855 RepID=A0A9P6E4W4_9AGAR|nr:signal recognition particle, SRP9/SRP14 subunit [Crepidotus variabilis]
MVYIHSWQEFQDAAEDLYTKSPNDSRYCVKWKSSEGKLVLKITDNTACIKFKTNSSIFLNRFEALNLSLMQKMQNQRRKEEPLALKPVDVLSSTLDVDRANSPLPAQSSSVVPTQVPSNAGVKKKKAKKKKG